MTEQEPRTKAADVPALFSFWALLCHQPPSVAPRPRAFMTFMTFRSSSCRSDGSPAKFGWSAEGADASLPSRVGHGCINGTPISVCPDGSVRVTRRTAGTDNEGEDVTMRCAKGDRAMKITWPELMLIAGTRAMLGAGIGLLVAGKLTDDERLAIGSTLFAVGAITTVPLIMAVRRRPDGQPVGA
jgi:hypothetical protein